MVEKFNSVPDTLEHKTHVKNYLKRVANDLIVRGRNHDNSKLQDPEKYALDTYIPQLNETEFGSDEREKCLGQMEEMRNHHYKYNDHHPEHFENGIKDMNLIQLIEMVCDWMAACKRRDEDVVKSIEINQGRFGYSDELKSILLSTITYIENETK